MEAQAEQDVAGVHVVRDAGIAQSAQERRIVLANQPVALFVGDRDAVAQVAVRAQIPPVEGDREAVLLGGRRHHHLSRADHLGAYAVPAYARDPRQGATASRWSRALPGKWVAANRAKGAATELSRT